MIYHFNMPSGLNLKMFHNKDNQYKCYMDSLFI